MGDEQDIRADATQPPEKAAESDSGAQAADQPVAESVDAAEEEQARSRGRRMRFYGGDGDGLPSYDVD